ncbi:glycosyl transferase [Dyella amyloliquefaciens]|uniref:glycosyl transferase n=1 Tax=Dyella amyloliquefaciens TaxID=1770545 RepID=UPI001E394A17|nr:glycosyl transferase [Dyella amyloliquefaciens]
MFAAHHLSSNVAAERFKGLLKYMDPEKYRIFVFARQASAAAPVEHLASSPGMRIIALPGHCVGSESSARSSLLTLASAFARSLPFRERDDSAQATSWLVQALAEADRLCRERVAAGEHCVAIGTYSPVDSLIAASNLASRYGIGCMQDFRDGLVFEALGKPGKLRNLLRTLIERRVVENCDLITSVSGPLVDDFRRRYPHKTAKVLPNGFDPADFERLAGDADGVRRANAILAEHVPAGSTLIGHFGRIGASDGSASLSLDYLVDALNRSGASATGKHLMFVGELTEGERGSIGRATFPVTVIPPVERSVALQLMKHCDKLLLLTGSRVSCATGKLFDYLATGADVVCVTRVWNAATVILKETGAGCALLTDDGDAGIQALREALFGPGAGAQHDISAYNRIVQAGLLDNWISRMVTA